MRGKEWVNTAGVNWNCDLYLRGRGSVLNKIDRASPLSLPLFFSRLCNIDCIIRRKIGPRRRLMLIKRGNFARISRLNFFIRCTHDRNTNNLGFYPCCFPSFTFHHRGIIDLSLLEAQPQSTLESN